MSDVVMCHLSQPQENMAATPAPLSLFCSWLVIDRGSDISSSRMAAD